MKIIPGLLLISSFLYAGIVFFLIAFGIKKPAFKTMEKQLRFERLFEKYHLLFKAAALFYLVSFGVTLWDSGFLKRVFRLLTTGEF